MVEGRRTLLTGSQKASGALVEIDGLPIAKVTTSLENPVNSLLFPGVGRREFVSPRGVGQETILAAPTLPFAVFQWNGDAGPGSIEVEVPACEVRPRSEPVGESGVETESPGDSVATDRGDAVDGPVATHRAVAIRLATDKWVGVAVTPAPKSLAVEPAVAAHGSVSVLIDPAKGAPVSVVIAAGTSAEVCGAFTAAGHASGHAVRAASGTSDEGLVLETGVEEIDDAVAWAAARLAGLAAQSRRVSHEESGTAHEPSGMAHEQLSLGLAALAIGDRDTADVIASHMAPGSPSAAILAAQTALALGDTRMATVVADELLAGGRPPATDADSGIRRLGARLLADALRYAAPDSTILALRAWPASSGEDLVTRSPASPTAAASTTAESTASENTASESTAPEGDSGSGRRLPMARPVPQPTSEADWLSTLLAGVPGGAPTRGTDGRRRTDAADTARRMTALFLKDPPAAWVEWRHILSEGLESGPHGPATWDRREALTELDEVTGGSVTAELLLALTHGLLGIAPDAPVGRLHLAPRLPSHLTRFAARGIRVGDTTISLEFERTGSTLRYTLVPEYAPVPPLVVFAPTVCGEVTSVSVDGQPADLEVTTHRGLTTISLQLPVDGRRVVEVEVA